MYVIIIGWCSLVLLPASGALPKALLLLPPVCCLQIHLTLTIEELGPGRCRQSLTGRIRVNVFGVGRVVEGIVRDSLQTTYRKLPAIVERWAAFRSRALAQGNGHALVAGRPPVGQRISWIRREVAPLRDGGGSVESEAVAAAAAAAIAEGSMLPDQATESTKNTQPSPAPSLAAPEPQPSESPELLKRRAAAARTTRPLDLSQAEILYYDANDALGEPSPGPVPPTNPPLQPSPSPLPNPRPETVAAVTSPPAPRVLAQPRPPPSHHHRHSNSVDSVELALDADMAEHMASSRLWGRFNRYWDDWSAYWAAQGVEEEARAEEEAEVQARGGTVVGGLLSAVGRELYLGGSALLLVTYLSAMRLGLPTHPDHGLQRGEGQRSRPLPPPLPPKAAVVSPGPRPQLSLDRAEAELARALVKDGKPFQVTSSANEGDDSAVICAAVPAVPGEGGGAVVGSAAAKNGKKRKAARVCLTCSWMHCSATHSA